MRRSNEPYLRELRTHASEVRAFLGNANKPERERAVCRAFLRALGVAFEDSELVAPAVEPADVNFRDARFQVCELLHGRHPQGDWKEREIRYKEAMAPEDVLQPPSKLSSMSFGQLIPEVTEALTAKSKKYGVGCERLDALIYANLEDSYLKADSSIPDLSLLMNQGWRSVSVLFLPYAFVAFSVSDSPCFLQNAARHASMKWLDVTTLFEPTSGTV